MDSLLRCSLFFLLIYFLTLVPVTVKGHGEVLRRQKREWILAPRNLTEGQDYTTYDHIAKIRSDKETHQQITYSLTGPGVNEYPQGRFSVDRRTGFVRVHSILDREEIAQYRLLGVAKYQDGTRAENDITLVINVVDRNDCTPVIKMDQVGQVSEHSKLGTVVMKVIATDDDDPATSHARIFYRIDESTNAAGMFSINSRTGEVIVAKTTLDRETKSIHKLTILASDMEGRAGGYTGTGEIEIQLTDINDNIPTLAQETYEGRVEENTIGIEVLRIQAVDLDLVQTDNWCALYEIVSGNEGGYFEITTDKKTNEGVIKIIKALDYEEIKTLSLGIRVKNVAEYNFGSSTVVSGASSSKSYPIKINVVNQKEGARFQPTVKVVTVSEEITTTSLTQVIATYAAIDSDTLKTATNVRYAKLYDADNWFSIDEKTAEIRLNKYPDRESIYLVNGTYYAKIICISDDIPAKTATGTIAIQVEDHNDHCPQLTSTAQTACYGENAIYVTAKDEDMYPNGQPFTFNVIDDNKGKWTLEPFNETTVILRNQGKLWPGNYKVTLNVKDQQGKSCNDLQQLDITVCTCEGNTKACNLRSKSNVKFGPGGILLLLLGLLLLLLIPLLLLFCLCGNAARDFKAIPFEANEHLISYHTEGQGEDKDVPLVQVPLDVDGSTINTKNINMSGGAAYLDNLAGAGMGGGGTLTGEEMWMDNKYNYYHANQDQMGFTGAGTMTGQEMGFMGAGTMTGREMGFMGAGTMTGREMSFSKQRLTAFDGMALPEHYLGQYYSIKTRQAPQQYLEKDKEVIYQYEEDDSQGASVGCCSLLENDNDLAFLNDLGPKFKTLAEICSGKSLESTSVDVGLSNLSKETVFTARPSTSTHTQVHTHTEKIRDREPVNVNTLSTFNKASGSSTLIQEERITEHAKASATLPKVKETVVIPNQTLLIQQPAMYYAAAAPMYVVESNPQMVLVSGGTQQVVGQVSQPGLSQGLIQVGGLPSSQGVVLVEGQVGVNGVSGQMAQGSSQGVVSTTNTQMFVVENGSSGGKHSTQYLQSSAHVPQRSSQAGFEVGGKGVQVKSFSAGSRGSAGSKEDFTLATTPRLQGGQRVVVQHKKVSVTERNIESNT
ncbi:PREDICTED: desmoglein-2-like isoform X2 [Poecilia mexicana]|uniref:desmoglein-2-like isoform X2 n=1 Tax=Poecilia mexicana TaxID=48701 RepID=UPI00072EC082|nr:PREDICTED: desmoglein-2-like isoform X2 [Poecilia mexicana]